MIPTSSTQAVPTSPADGTPVPALDPAAFPKLDDLVTEDGAPVENIYTEKQYRLLTEPLYSSWPGPGEGRSFLALANVGWFYTYGEPPLVPDALLSLNAAPAGNLRTKAGHSYFQWLIGKSPDVLIEIISDRRGGEEDFKMMAYARQHAPYYVIHDPNNLLKGGVLRAFRLEKDKYEPIEPRWLPEVGLGLILWEGTFEGQQQTWLRWCDQEGHVIPTGAERAETESRRAEIESRRADEAAAKAERLAAQLRAQGIEPETE